MSERVVTIHAALWNIYSDVLADPGRDDISGRLDALRQSVIDEKCAASLEAYENYLKMIALHVRPAMDAETYSLLIPDVFRVEMARQPGLPFAILGMAMVELKLGNRARGRHLLRRLSATLYRERRRGQALLAQLVDEEAAA